MKRSKLHTINKTGYKTSDNYFYGLEDSIMSQIKLKEMVETTGFNTPDNYFEDLDSTILNKVESKPKVISLFNKRNLIYVSGIAAALIISLNIFNNSTGITFDDLELMAIESYIANEDISSYELAALLNEEQLETYNFIETNINQETIEDYLLENTTIEDLITE